MITYDLGNIADWLSAIGTVGATVVALYLAQRDVKPKLKVVSKYNYIINGSVRSGDPFEILIEVVNQGLVPVTLTECSVEIGKERLAFVDNSHIVNKLLNPGELHVHVLEYECIKKYLLENGIRVLKTKAFFKDAIGNKYSSKITLRS